MHMLEVLRIGIGPFRIDVKAYPALPHLPIWLRAYSLNHNIGTLCHEFMPSRLFRYYYWNYGALGARGMHSLQSYGQSNPVHDNNAYTITSIYHGGQLKMFTSHPFQPTSPRGRPEYYMNQVKGWSMTGDLETFRQGATYFRNGRDWTKEQRDEAIRLANERAGESQAGVLPVDASFGQTFSVASETTVEEDYTLSQESENLLDEGSNTTIHLQDSDTSSGELALERGPPAKRSSRHSKRSRQSQRRRRNTGGPDDRCSR